jgi:DNA mismatch repair protein MutL
MPDVLPRSRRIHLLRDEVARKIAAGEVIDRPLSIVRELLDNAIDAGATSIDVTLEAGGMGRVRVADDGAGMDAEDLALCWKPHATSKIETEDDLLRVTSLGFRGEALSSIALCSRLVMTSCAGSEGTPHRLEVHGGRQVSFGPCPGRPGTVVDVSELFYNFPARRKFLRSVSAESGLCRGVFVDRAVAHSRIAFRLVNEGEQKLLLPPADAVQRIAAAWSALVDGRLLREITAEGEGFRVRIVAGEPELRRRDRKLLQAFVNGRRVSEYALLQAAEHGYAGWMPGGWYPVAFVFVSIDPGLVDFNIHPAKKEVRFRNLPDVHRVISGAIHGMLAPHPRTPVDAGTPFPSGEAAGDRLPLAERPRPGFPLRVSPDPVPRTAQPDIRFLGQAFGVFLLFELPGRLILMDQHAAHERVIFERLGARAPAVQELLFPLGFDVSEDEARSLDAAQAELAGLGVVLRRAGARAFEVTALSDDMKVIPEERLIELLRDARGAEWRDRFRAGAACRMAIKEGDRVDPVTAVELCAKSLALPVARCPHGRPIWHEVSETDLLRLVDRPATSRTATGPTTDRGAAAPRL